MRIEVMNNLLLTSDGKGFQAINKTLGLGFGFYLRVYGFQAPVGLRKISLGSSLNSQIWEYIGISGYILGLYRDNGKENGSYYT